MSKLLANIREAVFAMKEVHVFYYVRYAGRMLICLHLDAAYSLARHNAETSGLAIFQALSHNPNDSRHVSVHHQQVRPKGVKSGWRYCRGQRQMLNMASPTCVKLVITRKILSGHMSLTELLALYMK